MPSPTRALSCRKRLEQARRLGPPRRPERRCLHASRRPRRPIISRALEGSRRTTGRRPITAETFSHGLGGFRKQVQETCWKLDPIAHDQTAESGPKDVSRIMVVSPSGPDKGSTSRMDPGESQGWSWAKRRTRSRVRIPGDHRSRGSPSSRWQ